MMNFYNMLDEMTVFEAQIYSTQGLEVECNDGKVVGLHMSEDKT